MLGAAAIVMMIGSAAATARQGVGGGLPCEVASRPSLDSADESQVRQFAADNLRKLQSAAPAESSAAREALIGPLSCSGVTFAFRLKYSDILTPALTPLVSGADERLAANSLVILSRMRTSLAADAMAPGLKSASAVVRFAAGSGHRRLFHELSRDAFGFNDAGIDRLFDAVSAALTTEPDAITADMYILALGEGARGNAAMRGRAAHRLAEAYTARILSLRRGNEWSESWSAATLRALDLVRQTLFEQAGSGQIDREFARRACLLSGQVIAAARDRLASSPGTASDADLVRSVGAAEGLAVIAHNSLSGQKLGEKGMQRLFEQAAGGARQEEFIAAAEAWIGKEGLLMKAPISANSADFAQVR